MGLLEWGHGKGIPAEITRKIMHMAGGLFAFSLPFIVSFYVAISLGVLSFILLFVTQKKHILNSIHKVPRKTSGAVLFPIGLLLSTIIFWPIDPQIFQISALVLGFADGASGLVDYRFNKPTWVGSLIFFLITAFIFVGGQYYDNAEFTFIIIIMIIGGSGIVTVGEAVSKKGWDNVTVPILAGAVYYLCV